MLHSLAESARRSEVEDAPMLPQVQEMDAQDGGEDQFISLRTTRTASACSTAPAIPGAGERTPSA
jgi:hypothetical protein